MKNGHDVKCDQVSHWVRSRLLSGQWVIVMLIFGTKKVANMEGDLGKAVKGFKDGVNGSNESAASDAAAFNHRLSDVTTELKYTERNIG